MPTLRRVSWALGIAGTILIIGMLFWHFPTWLSSVLILTYVVITIVRRWPKGGNRHPQENDPNRR